MDSKDVRWKQRFQNFDRAFVLLRSAFEEKEISSFSVLEQEGIIQRFEYTYGLIDPTNFSPFPKNLVIARFLHSTYL